MSWIRAIGRFFQRIIFMISLPFRRLFAGKTGLEERRPGFFRILLFPIVWLFGLIYQIISNVLEVIVGWSSSRESRAILMALPAVIAFGLFCFVLIYLYNTKSGALVNTYLLRATRAENVESYETARMYYQKLLQLDRANQSYEFHIARSYDSEGNLEEASRRMKKLLSQPDVAGVVNFWFAQKMLEREDLSDDQKWKQCLLFLQNFLEEAPKHREANLLALEANSTLSKMYFDRGLVEPAVDYMLAAERIAETLTEISQRSYLALAQIQRRLAIYFEALGNQSMEDSYETSAIQSIVKATSYFSQQYAENPRQVEFLLLLSDCYLFQKDYAKAISQIDLGIRMDNQQRYTKQLLQIKARLLGQWAEMLINNGLQIPDPKLVAGAIQKIEAALLIDPKNARALSLLARIVVSKIDEVSLTAKQRLDSALIDTAAPFGVHLILGSYAAAEEDYERAIRHLRQARLLNPKATAVMNNLAFVLSRMEEPRPKDALALINLALKAEPRNPRFLDTRGNIYLAMEEYELAFHDLEVAETKLKNNPKLYENLLSLVDKLQLEDIYRKKYQDQLNRLKSVPGNLP